MCSLLMFTAGVSSSVQHALCTKANHSATKQNGSRLGRAVQHWTANAGFGLCGDEGLHMETRDLRCALTQPYASTFRTFTVPVRLWSLSEKVLARFSLCIERCAYNSVNCIMAN